MKAGGRGWRIVVLAGVLGVRQGVAVPRTWTGGAGTGLASTPGNWTPAGAPEQTDDIILDGTSQSNLMWNAAATLIVASWQQSAAYTGTVTFLTGYSGPFTNFTITGDCVISNGTWTHQTNREAEVYWLAVTVGGNMEVGSQGRINVDRKGYSSGSGGPGRLDPWYGSTHGGAVAGSPKATYGSATQPITLGSSGGASPSLTSAGGGAVSLRVGGTLLVNGTICANGGPSPSDPYPGGSGGSLWLSAGTLAGTGVIEANGASSGARGGGAGGRISLVDVQTFAFSGTLQARGRAGSWTYGRGYNGTIAFPSGFDLTLSTNGLRSLGLGSDGVYDYRFGNIVIEEGAELWIDGHPNLAGGAGSAARLYASNLVIRAGGRLHADACGFPCRRGPGAVTLPDRAGGTHGGVGALNTQHPYGCATNPMNLGSGGAYVIADGNAGGALILDVAEKVRVDGTLSANGETATYGGGSGGSIWIRCATLEGSGVISANGGTSGSGGGAEAGAFRWWTWPLMLSSGASLRMAATGASPMAVGDMPARSPFRRGGLWCCTPTGGGVFASGRTPITRIFSAVS